MIVKMLTHVHVVVYTWWCWHIYEGEVFRVEVDQLSKEKEVIVSDQTLVSTGHARLVTHSRGGVALASHDLTLGEQDDLTRSGHVRS
jgi:hypothetical protein